MLSFVWFLLVAIALASAVVDVVTYRIPNAFVVTLVVLFFAVALIHRSEVDWLSHLGALGLILGAGIFLYSFGQMGAGDVKLMSALALWAGVIPLVSLLFWISLCGLVGMAVILVLRRLPPVLQPDRAHLPKRDALRVLKRGEGIPYGIGIGPGAILASFSFPSWLWHE